MANYLHADTQNAKAIIARLLEEFPELEEDSSLRADMIDGETDFNKLISIALEQRSEAASMSDAIKSRIGDLSTRKARFDKKADTMKAVIHSLMDAAKLDKLALPEATISILSPREKVEILNAEELPQGYYTTEIKPDKKAILAALKSGNQIPGAELALGEESLMVRMK